MLFRREEGRAEAWVGVREMAIVWVRLMVCHCVAIKTLVSESKTLGV